MRTADERPFDYGKLRRRIKEKCGTQSAFAEIIGLSDVSVSNKLNNNVDWGQEEIENAVYALDIPPTEIYSYFFTRNLVWIIFRQVIWLKVNVSAH